MKEAFHSTVKVLYKEFPLNMRQIAEHSQVSRVRVQQLVQDIHRSGLAAKIGPEWRFKHETLDWMANRHGRKK